MKDFVGPEKFFIFPILTDYGGIVNAAMACSSSEAQKEYHLDFSIQDAFEWIRERAKGNE